MSSPTDYIVFTSGAATGFGWTPDGTLPAGAIACSGAQAVAWQHSTLMAGAIVAATAQAAPPQDQAQALLASGLAVTSTGTPAISATYATDPANVAKLLGVELGIAAGQGFPGGASTFPIRIVGTGTPPLLTITQYAAVAVEIRNFVAQADLVIDGFSTTLPAAAATIA